MVKSGLLMLIVLVLLGGTSLSAQPRPMRPPVDPLGENLFPPELVMQHQQALELTEEQRSLIRGEIQNAQARFTEVQWQLQNEMETMASLVKQGRNPGAAGEATNSATPLAPYASFPPDASPRRGAPAESRRRRGR